MKSRNYCTAEGIITKAKRAYRTGKMSLQPLLRQRTGTKNIQRLKKVTLNAQIIQ